MFPEIGPLGLLMLLIVIAVIVLIVRAILRLASRRPSSK